MRQTSPQGMQGQNPEGQQEGQTSSFEQAGVQNKETPKERLKRLRMSIEEKKKVAKEQEEKKKKQELEAKNSNTMKYGVLRSSLNLGETDLHPTHRMHHRRGIVWCWTCGCYASEAARELRDVCAGEPTRGRNYFLNRLKDQKTPRKSMTWPMAEGEGPPEGPVIDG